MKPRVWLTLITLVLLVLVVVLGWREITRAWALLARVDLWILALMVPVQVLSYFATGEVVFTYLRSKGELGKTTRWQMARLALELNFVNHILPSGITASFTYLGWVLNRHGVSAGRATMAQLVRFVLGFVGYLSILVLSVGVLAFDREVNRPIIFTSASLATVIVGLVLFVIYATSDQRRLQALAGRVTRTVNTVVARFSMGRRSEALKLEAVEGFFGELRQDRREIRADMRLLVRPFLWALVLNCLDVALLYIAFASLGFSINPAIVVIAFGLSSVASIVTIAPGGAGVYEAAMILFLASAGVPGDTAIAGTLLARVVLFLGTILFGYLFYQLTISRFGKSPI